LHKQILATIYS